MISFPSDSQSRVEDFLSKRGSGFDLRVDCVIDLESGGGGEGGSAGGEEEQQETRLKRVGTESKTFGLMIPTASKISSLFGQRAIAEPWATKAFSSAV
jgi:hypothetical protein